MTTRMFVLILGGLSGVLMLSMGIMANDVSLSIQGTMWSTTAFWGIMAG